MLLFTILLSTQSPTHKHLNHEILTFGHHWEKTKVLQLAPFFNERCNEEVTSIATNMTLHNKQYHVEFDEFFFL
jgi:hypothetical protein